MPGDAYCTKRKPALGLLYGMIGGTMIGGSAERGGSKVHTILTRHLSPFVRSLAVRRALCGDRRLVDRLCAGLAHADGTSQQGTHQHEWNKKLSRHFHSLCMGNSFALDADE